MVTKRQWRIRGAGHPDLTFGAVVRVVWKAVRLHQEIIVLQKPSITKPAIHTVPGKGPDETGVDTLVAFLPRFHQAQLFGCYQGMIPQIQIRDETPHATTAPGRSD